METPKQPHPLLRRWEGLRPRWQFLISLPPLVALLWIGHVEVLNQPVGRGLFYGIFWGVTFAALVTVASQTEARKRKGWSGEDD
jgi:hypothetical protein